ncbi:VaFE repeat-containing surface-anchored protein [Corynebacterium rhinophilum]|uniref:VaFE repeat-containing surface-anchored protein n=1 Tax=Corynebacterium rhinophilum TaxID=3050197 RepID=UPI00397B0EE9
MSAIISDPSGREAAINFINGNLGYGDANNVSRFQGFEGSPQEFTELTGLRIVKTTAQNLDDQFDVDPSVKIDKQPADAFLTIVGPNGIYKHTSGGGQRVLPPDQPGLPDDDGGEDRNPEISTQAEFAGDADQVVAGAKVTDTVEYKDLVPGKKYTLNAELVNKADKSVVGKGEKTFTPQESAGKVDVEITVDSDVTEPVEAAVAFEELTSTEVDAKGEETPDAEKPNKVAEHKDIDDADQTVTSKKDEKPEKSDRNPEISTQAEFAGDADQVVAGAKVTDTVEYKDLVPGKKYTLNAELVNKADKSVVGKGEKTFTPQESAGKVDVEITVDSDVTEPVEAAVAFEELTSTEVDAKGEETPDAEKPNKVAEHKDIDDADQTVTSKKDEKPEKSDRNPEISTQAEFAGDADQVVAGAKVTDTVEYKDLVPGKKYTLNAELVNKADKSVVGKGEKTFTPQESAGKVDVEITVDSDVTEPVEAAVAFEELTSTEVDAKGEETPDAEKPNKVAEHKDIDDADQTVTSKKDEKPEKSDRNPEISTQAEFAGDADQVVAGAKVTDTVEYKDLVPGKKYTLNAELVNKADKSVVGKGEKTFTPQESAGKVDVEITVDSDVTEPVEAAVAFEELTSTEVDAKGEETPDAEKPNKVAEHKDIDDADQTVTSKKDEKPEKSDRNPEISTQAEFAGDADQVVAGAKVTDTVEYKDLVPGKKYTLNAELVNKADKSVVGKGEKTFTPQESAGKVDVEITVDSDVTEPVEAAVAFEELTSTEVDAKGEETPDAEKPNKVAEHKDIDDADQTVTSKKDEKPEKSDRNPEISTQAEFAGDADQVVAGAKVTDTVEYKDLVPGKKYTLNAELVNKADKSVVGKGEKTFTPQESAGKVDVEITVDSDVTEPVEAAVAFEELTSTEVDAKGEETPDAEKPNKVAEHKDIDDADQTVTSKKDEKPEKDNKPSETSTPMTSTSSSKPSTSESKSSEPKKETTSESKPSEPSETKTSSSKTSANAKPSTSTSSEKSKEPRPTEVQGQEPGDSPEPKITTDADFAEGSHVVVAGAKIVDEVSYEGLVPGKEYTLKAELISKKDEKTVLGTGEKTFTPEKSAGKVDVEITVHDDVTEPVEAAVAFEELTSVEVDAKGEETPDVTPEKPNHIAEHKDINDDDQTVTSKKDEKPESKPKEKAEGQSERPSVKVKEQDAPAQADKGTGKVEQHVDITNHVPGKTGKPLPSDAKRTEIKAVPSGATELEPGMQTYIK